VKIAPFATEQFYALYEFNTPHLLSVSDCETVTVGELLRIAGTSLDDLGALRLGYTESQGHPDLRAAIASTYERVSADEVVVLTSPVEGIYLTMQALLDPGDEAIVLMPAYDSLKNVAEHICGSVHAWELIPTATGWRLDFDALEQMMSDETQLIVVNFPHNPTGYLPSADEFATLIDIARWHNTWLFSDEMYRGLEFSGAETLPSAADLYERSVVLSGLSKAYGLPGLRAGWLIVRNDIARHDLINWKHYTTICPPAPSEFLAMAALAAREQLIARSNSTIVENLQLVESFFERWRDFFTWRPPQAGSVALVGVDVPSATEYCHELARTAGVLLLPSSCMGYGDKHVRFGFGRAAFPAALQHYEGHLRQTLESLR
jgi:aspartate/methionine/tyrosine aminotransferase